LDVILTVPLAKADAPQTSALPQQAMAAVTVQRGGTTKAPPKAKAKPGESRPPIRSGHSTPKRTARPDTGSKRLAGLLSLGLGVAVLLGGGLYYAIAVAGKSGTPD